MKSYSEWVKDTNPGNYVSVDVTGLPLQLVSALPGQTNDKPHITLMYSKDSAVPFDHVAYVLKRKNIIGAVVPVVGVDIFPDSESTPGQKLGCIVLKVKHPMLTDIHEHLLRIGCKHSFTPFEPHATLIYKCPIEQCELALVDLKKTIAADGIFLTCTKYNNEAVNKNWVNDLAT